MLLHGKVIRILLPRDEADGFTIFSYIPEELVESDGRNQIVCEGKLPLVAPEMPLELEVDHKKGNRYLLKSSRICTSRKSYSLYYLNTVKGISGKTANRILSGLDGDIGNLKTMEDPEGYLKKIPGSSRFMAPLLEQMRYITQMEELFMELSQFGLEFIEIDKLLRKYKGDALEKVRENPYRLCRELKIGFVRADYMARYYKGSMYAPERLKAAAWELIRANEERGNTRIRIKELIRLYNRLLKQSAWPWAVSPVYLFAVMHTMLEIRIEDGYVSYNLRYNQEREIARNILRLDSTAPGQLVSEEQISDLESAMGIEYLDSQKELFRAMGSHNVILLCGKPGTGKTTIIQGAIHLFHALYPDRKVSLCAPTARAAQVLKDATGHPASTIHVLANITPGSGLNDYGEKLGCGLLVVDEMSMVDVETFYYLAKAVDTGCQVILSGDPDQLESVGCGSVFRDLLESGKFCRVNLSYVLRQDQGSSIIRNCANILSGDSDLIMDDSFRCIHFQTEEEAAKTVGLLCKGNKPIGKEQVLSTTKVGRIGTNMLNQELEKAAPGQECIRFHGFDFKVGDKVVFSINNYAMGYCNGDIGMVKSIGVSHIEVQLADQLLRLDKRFMEDILPAKVMKIHKSQGSEVEEVLIMLPEHPASLLNRNLLNTAVSRAKTRVTILSIGNALEMAIEKKPDRRDTWLPAFIRV